MSEEMKLLRFKRSDELYQMQAKDGFVFLDRHEREYEASYAEALVKRMPKNFEIVINKVQAKPVIEEKSPIEKQPDKMVKNKKPVSKRK